MANPSVTDCSGLLGTPNSIFQPQNPTELRTFLSDHPNLALRIGGGLTGVSGGAVPDAHETYIDLSRCSELSWYDHDSGIVIAEAGATMQSLHDLALEGGWQFPVMPGSKEKATIGGMVACNGGGPLSLKYGKMAHWILGVDIVKPNGEEHRWGGPCTKVSEGCDWKSLIVGSEGTLGIITRVILRCAPSLPSLHHYRFASDDFFALLPLIPSLLQRDAYLIEIADEPALRFSSQAPESVLWTALPSPWTGELPKGIRCQISEPSQLDERFAIGYGLQDYKRFIDLDVCFPVKNACSALRQLQGWFDLHQFEHVFFGHAGDGNYHIHVFFNDDVEKWQGLCPEFDAMVRHFEGHLSGEHGIGKIHRNRLNRPVESIESAAYIALKNVLDPAGQLPTAT